MNNPVNSNYGCYQVSNACFPPLGPGDAALFRFTLISLMRKLVLYQDTGTTHVIDLPLRFVANIEREMLGASQTGPNITEIMLNKMS